MNKILTCLIVFFCFFLNISYAGQTYYLEGDVKSNIYANYYDDNDESNRYPTNNILNIRDINIGNTTDDMNVCVIGAGLYDEEAPGGGNVLRAIGSNISSRQCALYICGGDVRKGQGDAKNDRVIISKSKLDINAPSDNTTGVIGLIMAGSFSYDDGNAIGNKVIISESEVTVSGGAAAGMQNRIVGGYAGGNDDFQGSGDSRDNEVNIFPGVRFFANDIEIYGGYSSSKGNAVRNRVNIYNIGERVSLFSTSIYGGRSLYGGEMKKGNALKLVTDAEVTFEAKMIGNFEIVNIYIVGDPLDYNPIVSLEYCQDLNKTVSIGLSLDTIVPEDHFIVLHNKNRGLDNFSTFHQQTVEGEYKSLLHMRRSKFDLKLLENNILATLESDEMMLLPESISYLCSRVAAVYSLNALTPLGDIVETMYADEFGDYGTAGSVRGLQAFGKIYGGLSKYKNIEQGLKLTGFGGVAGIANKFGVWGDGDTAIWGLVSDFRKESYDVSSIGEFSSREVAAKGKVNNLGMRAFGKITLGEDRGKLAGMYLDGSIGIGNQETDYETDSIKPTIPITIIGDLNQFDFSASYWLADIGCGAKYLLLVADKKLYLDTFIKYGPCYIGKTCVFLPDDEALTFCGTWLHRARLGLKGILELKQNVSLSSDLFLEQGIGKVKAESGRGFRAEDLSLTGTTIYVELGARIDIKEKFKIDLVLQSFAISRSGYNVMVNFLCPFGKSISKETDYSNYATYPAREVS
jgi:hypothetical protein